MPGSDLRVSKVKQNYTSLKRLPLQLGHQIGYPTGWRFHLNCIQLSESLILLCEPSVHIEDLAEQVTSETLKEKKKRIQKWRITLLLTSRTQCGGIKGCHCHEKHHSHQTSHDNDDIYIMVECLSQKSLFPYSRYLVVSHVYKLHSVLKEFGRFHVSWHFPYSRDLVVSMFFDTFHTQKNWWFPCFLTHSALKGIGRFHDYKYFPFS